MSSRVVATGRAIVTNRIRGSGTEPTYAGWGTGTTDVADGNTGLETPAAEARTNGTPSRVTTTTTDDTWRLVATITATGARAITEMGLFDASTSGNLFLRSVFSVINLAIGDAIQFTVDVQLTSTTT